MEESLDMHNKGDILPHEKIKRKLKTPEQIEALEKFYNEHKYPSESMKLEFAKQIGLSEKQVSGWFCHRRLKDKKLLQGEVFANGRQSVSNGAMQDYASGLRQESCSSTKQGDRYLDSKEVESKMFYRHNSSAAVLASEHKHKGRHIDYTVSDDRSTGSSSASASQERLLEENEVPYAMKPSRYQFQDENYILMDANGVKRRGHVMDSRYSYLQADIECPAVASVKRKLGGRYREDGPTLGVIFDQLPPGAFDTPIRDSNYDPYYVGDYTRDRPYSIPRISKEPKAKNKNRCEMPSTGSCREGIDSERTMEGYHYELIGSQLSQKASFAKHLYYAPSQTFVMETTEDSVGKVSDHNNRKNGRNLKYRIDGRSNSGIDHRYPGNSLKAHGNNLSSYPLQYNNSASMAQREAYGDNVLYSARQSNGFLNTENIVQPRRPIKKGKISKETPTFEKRSLLRQEMLMTKDINTGRKTDDIMYQQQNYLMRTSQTSGCTNPIMRYSRDVMTSTGEDETGGSTSSG